MDASGEVIASRSAPITITPLSRVLRPTVRGVAAAIAPEVPGATEMALGNQYFRMEQKVKAREQYEIALSKNSKLGPAIEAVAVMEMEDGNTARVIELLEPVYENVQDRYIVLALLGEAYFRQKEYLMAIEILDKALTLQRPGSQLLNSLALSYYQLGDVHQAKPLLERSLQADPDQPKIKELLQTLQGPAPEPR